MTTVPSRWCKEVPSPLASKSFLRRPAPCGPELTPDSDASSCSCRRASRASRASGAPVDWSIVAVLGLCADSDVRISSSHARTACDRMRPPRMCGEPSTERATPLRARGQESSGRTSGGLVRPAGSQTPGRCSTGVPCVLGLTWSSFRVLRAAANAGC